MSMIMIKPASSDQAMILLLALSSESMAMISDNVSRELHSVISRISSMPANVKNSILNSRKQKIRHIVKANFE